jgi:acyl-CoA reductase-like NAD-dependent aldehyde dehydrogenase
MSAAASPPRERIETHRPGFYIEPTILTGNDTEIGSRKNYSLLSRPSTRRDEEEAIALANDTSRKVVNVAPPGPAAAGAVRLADDLEGE